MSLADSLLRAVIADPDDDAPRLIYADWLDENGDPERAEFIRVQCEQARTPRWERRWQELAWRGEALLARHGPRWRGELPVLDDIRWIEFERGFPSTVRVPDLATLYRHDAALAAAAPLYRAEILEFDERTVPYSTHRLRWLRAVRLDHGSYASVNVHGHRSVFEAIRELEVVRAHQDVDDVQWLIRHCGPIALTSLAIAGSHATSGDLVRRLADANWAENLTRLELGTRFVDYNSGYFEDPYLGTDGARTLAQRCPFRRLETLNLDRQAIASAGLAALLAAPQLAGVRDLSVRSCAIDDASSFVASSGAALDRLDLSDNPIGDDGVRALAAAPRLQEVKSLHLDTCEVGPQGLHCLTSAPLWQTLRRLDLSRNPLGAEGAWVLARADPPSRLHALSLVDADLDAEAGKILAAIPWLRQLTTLELAGNALETPGAAALARLAGGALRHLGLARTGLSPDALTALVPLLPQLIVLDLEAASRPDATPFFAALCKDDNIGLQTLKLRQCSFFDPLSAVRRLVLAPVARRLVDLDLAHCPALDDAEALLLANSPSLLGLVCLDLRGNTIRQTALEALVCSPHLANVVDFRVDYHRYAHGSDLRPRFEERFRDADE